MAQSLPFADRRVKHDFCDMQRRALHPLCMSIHERLRQARTRRGFSSAAEAARALAVPYGTYSGHESGLRGIKRADAERYAAFFRVPLAWLLTGDGAAEHSTVPIVGIAGASADGALSYGFESSELGEAPMPPGGTERTVAVEVRGDSLRGVAEDGWLVYYDDRRDPITPDLLGELCVVGLEDGRTLIKTPYAGRGPGLFDLESTNATTIRDVPVRWAALVTAIVPRSPARKLIRRRG
jgi:transcriptional regulator with XRE-family HTH domain